MTNEAAISLTSTSVEKQATIYFRAIRVVKLSTRIIARTNFVIKEKNCFARGMLLAPIQFPISAQAAY